MTTLAPVKTSCPAEVLEAIYRPSPTKAQDLEESLNRWWRVYSSRKMSVPEEEYAANGLIYDPNHLPHTPTTTPTAK